MLSPRGRRTTNAFVLSGQVNIHKINQHGSPSNQKLPHRRDCAEYGRNNALFLQAEADLKPDLRDRPGCALWLFIRGFFFSATVLPCPKNCRRARRVAVVRWPRRISAASPLARRANPPKNESLIPLLQQLRPYNAHGVRSPNSCRNPKKGAERPVFLPQSTSGCTLAR